MFFFCYNSAQIIMLKLIYNTIMANKLDNTGSNVAVALPKCLKLKDYCFLITYQNNSSKNV